MRESTRAAVTSRWWTLADAPTSLKCATGSLANVPLPEHPKWCCRQTSIQWAIDCRLQIHNCCIKHPALETAILRYWGLKRDWLVKVFLTFIKNLVSSVWEHCWLHSKWCGELHGERHPCFFCGVFLAFCHARQGKEDRGPFAKFCQQQNQSGHAKPF